MDGILERGLNSLTLIEMILCKLYPEYIVQTGIL